MTLLVGILASDGVVVAADRAVTFGDGHTMTIKDSHRKIVLIEDSPIIVVGTGQVGLGQRFTGIVKQAWNGKQFNGTVVEVGVNLAHAAIQNFQSTNVQRERYGSLVAYAQNNQPQLIEFAVSDFQPEYKTDQCWYASMGSGQPLADPYLALMRRAVWTSGQPSIEDATFAAYWVMHQAIEAAPGFISKPIDVSIPIVNCL